VLRVLAAAFIKPSGCERFYKVLQLHVGFFIGTNMLHLGVFVLHPCDKKVDVLPGPG
jgi:hypothetical protein